MGVKMAKDLPFKTGFRNLIGSVIPECCIECDTAKFHYAFSCEDIGIFLLCKERDVCPLRNKETEDVTNGR